MPKGANCSPKKPKKSQHNSTTPTTKNQKTKSSEISGLLECHCAFLYKFLTWSRVSNRAENSEWMDKGGGDEMDFIELWGLDVIHYVKRIASFISGGEMFDREGSWWVGGWVGGRGGYWVGKSIYWVFCFVVIVENEIKLYIRQIKIITPHPSSAFRFPMALLLNSLGPLSSHTNFSHSSALRSVARPFAHWLCSPLKTFLRCLPPQLLWLRRLLGALLGGRLWILGLDLRSSRRWFGSWARWRRRRDTRLRKR